MNDGGEARVTLDEFVQRTEEINDNHQHGERVEAVEQRPREFAQQVFVENPHALEIRETSAPPREKSAGRLSPSAGTRRA